MNQKKDNPTEEKDKLKNAVFYSYILEIEACGDGLLG
jgi:hypothetical protein